MILDEILALQGKHAGETVFVIGSGPTLGEYSIEMRAALSNRVCIGVNRTQYLVGLKYFISSYISENILAKTVNSKTFTIHTRDGSTESLIPGYAVLKRIYSENVDDLKDSFDVESPYLITRNNVIFLATNLALIMGAKRIVYVGCEQRNGLHFYNSDDNILNRIVLDMSGVVHQYSGVFGKDHPYETPLNVMRALTTDPDILKNRPFYVQDHGQLLAQWVACLSEKFSREVYSCASDSVLIDAGAKYISLEDALSAY